MGKSVENYFTPRQLRKARIAKAIAHPARIAILEFMVFHQQCISVSLVSNIPLSQSTLAQHLKLLKAAGLIKGKIIGKQTFYYIDEKTWKETGTYFQNLFINFKFQTTPDIIDI